LSEGSTITAAADRAGVNRKTAYVARDLDDEFRGAWEDAFEQGTDLIEQEAWRRAVDGVDEPVYQGGKLVGVVRKYSDTVMLKLMAARRPDVYRERREIHHTGSGRPVSAGDLERIRVAGQRPELADAFDQLAAALGAEVREAGGAPAE
jgi:hypothetical protein